MTHDELQQRAEAIRKHAKTLQSALPIHLRLVPELTQALALVEDMSQLLFDITQHLGD